MMSVKWDSSTTSVTELYNQSTALWGFLKVECWLESFVNTAAEDGPNAE